LKEKFKIDMNLLENKELFISTLLEYYYYVSVYIPPLAKDFKDPELVKKSCSQDSECCEFILMSLSFLDKKSLSEVDSVALIAKVIADFEYLSNKIPDYQEKEGFNLTLYKDWKKSVLNLI